METTLITGSSSGIGLHLAQEFARHGHDLVLVAPVESELLAIAADLHHKHNVDVTVLAKDLRDPAAAEEIARAMADREIGILVNNAGAGQRGKAWEIDLLDDISMIRLNIEAVLRLTNLFLPAMVARGKGRITNTASYLTPTRVCNGPYSGIGIARFTSSIRASSTKTSISASNPNSRIGSDGRSRYLRPAIFGWLPTSKALAGNCSCNE